MIHVVNHTNFQSQTKKSFFFLQNKFLDVHIHSNYNCLGISLSPFFLKFILEYQFENAWHQIL